MHLMRPESNSDGLQGTKNRYLRHTKTPDFALASKSGWYVDSVDFTEMHSLSETHSAKNPGAICLILLWTCLTAFLPVSARSQERASGDQKSVAGMPTQMLSLYEGQMVSAVILAGRPDLNLQQFEPVSHFFSMRAFFNRA
jgi:hypothetical protein